MFISDKVCRGIACGDGVHAIVLYALSVDLFGLNPEHTYLLDLV